MTKSNWPLLIWIAVLIVWTAGLLVPDPLGGGSPEDDWQTAKFLVSKAAHLCVYGVLAAAACRLPFRCRLLALLVVHAALGEWLQTLVPSRFGSLRDVGIDLAGIGLGCVLAWPRKKAAAEAINPPPGESNL